jgi:hypothetical protein
MTTTIPNSVTSIGGCASFYDSTGLPKSVTSIIGGAFAGCSNLTNINIPNSVTTIGYKAFNNCSGLTTINIPNSVTTIKPFAFSGCSSLATISVASDNPKYDSRNNCNAIIETATNTLIAGCMNTTIPNSVTSIGEGAFSGCSNLTTINIPNSVTYIGEGAFSYCIYLNDVYCYATTPPKCYQSTFTNFISETNSATLHVPAASLAAYLAAPVWKDFKNIVGDAVAPTSIATSRDSVENRPGE